jgi:Uma2 family endonuclease
MSTATQKLMSVGEFLGWAGERDGRWELLDGHPIMMAPERVAHLEAQSEASVALRRSIERAGVPALSYPLIFSRAKMQPQVGASLRRFSLDEC